MSRNRAVLLGGVGAIVFAMVVWGLASSSMAPKSTAVSVPSDDDALHFEARGSGDRVELAQASPAPAPVQPTPISPMKVNQVAPAPAPTTPAAMMPVVDAGTVLPSYGRPRDAGVGVIGLQKAVLDAGAPAVVADVSAQTTPITVQTVAAEVVTQIEQARTERRAEVQTAVVDLSNVNAQLATGDTEGAIATLNAVSSSLGPAAQAQLRAAQTALDNKDLTSARIYINNAMALRRQE